LETHEIFCLSGVVGGDTLLSMVILGAPATPQEMADWLTNTLPLDAPTSLFKQRKANGRDKPWKLTYFAICMKPGGADGNMERRSL